MQTNIPSSTLLFAGETLGVTLLDGSTLSVRVRALPARHLNGYLDLRDVGREADLLATVVQISEDLGQKTENSSPSSVAPSSVFPGWSPVDAAFVDNLSDESHAALIALADKLNFSRAVSQAERQIATGTSLLPLKNRIAAAMMAPLEQGLRLLISSATTQITKAAAGTKL